MFCENMVWHNEVKKLHVYVSSKQVIEKTVGQKNWLKIYFGCFITCFIAPNFVHIKFRRTTRCRHLMKICIFRPTDKTVDD